MLLGLNIKLPNRKSGGGYVPVPGNMFIVKDSAATEYIVRLAVRDGSGVDYTVPVSAKTSDGTEYYVPAYDPSLYLDYTSTFESVPGKQPGYYLVDDVSGNLTQTTFSSLITFSRASNATRFSPTGQLEYAPHNLLLQSQDFATTWSWTRGSTTANTSVAPDGTLTGDKLVPNTDNNSHRVVQTVTTSAGTWTFSAYLKKGEYSGAEFRIADGTSTVTNSGTRTTVDLLTGSLSSTSFYGSNATAGSASIVDAGNDWYRVSVTVTVTSSAGSLQGQIFVQSVAGTTTYAGDGTSGIYAWGAQLAVGPNALDYTPTTTAVVYGPRFDYDPTTLAAKGLLIEEQRTNSIRNNTMVGAVAGTPGTLPTNWAAATPNNGLTREIVGVGTENGISYIDVRYSGTTTAASLTAVYPETGTQVAALSGQTWTNSFYVSLVGGSTANITLTVIGIDENNSGGVYLTGSTTSFTLTSGGLTGKRYAHTRTLNNASTAFVRPYMLFTYSSGVAIDITLRIGMPQLEQGAFATSVIPTTTAATTRSADIASIGTLSPWYNATEGTLYGEGSWVGLVASRFAVGLNNSASASSDFISIQTNPTTVTTGRGGVTAGGVTQAAMNITNAYTASVLFKAANAYQQDNFGFTVNGATPASDTSGTVPTVDRVQLGALSTTTANIWIRRVTYTPRRLTNAELQSLTS